MIKSGDKMLNLVNNNTIPNPINYNNTMLGTYLDGNLFVLTKENKEIESTIRLKISKLYDMWELKQTIPLIKTYNKTTRQINYKKIVNIERNMMCDLVNVKIARCMIPGPSGSKTILCSPNCKFLTVDGYVEAMYAKSKHIIGRRNDDVLDDFFITGVVDVNKHRYKNMFNIRIEDDDDYFLCFDNVSIIVSNTFNKAQVSDKCNTFNKAQVSDKCNTFDKAQVSDKCTGLLHEKVWLCQQLLLFRQDKCDFEHENAYADNMIKNIDLVILAKKLDIGFFFI
jgi:hypothetical protein